MNNKFFTIALITTQLFALNFASASEFKTYSQSGKTVKTDCNDVLTSCKQTPEFKKIAAVQLVGF